MFEIKMQCRSCHPSEISSGVKLKLLRSLASNAFMLEMEDIKERVVFMLHKQSCKALRNYIDLYLKAATSRDSGIMPKSVTLVDQDNVSINLNHTNRGEPFADGISISFENSEMRFFLEVDNANKLKDAFTHP